MKNLLTLFASLFIVILIASCSSSTGPNNGEQFEPYKVGTWLVTSPEKAQWQGDNSKSKTDVSTTDGDTIIIKDTKNKKLEIVRDTTRDHENFEGDFKGFNINYEDKTKSMPEDFYGDFDIITNKKDVIGGGIGGTYGGNDTLFIAKARFDLNCAKPSGSAIDVRINIFDAADSTHYRTFGFNVTGMMKVLEDLSGCN